MLLAALANAWLGGYHAGVEWKFWQGPTDCSGPVVDLGSAGTLLQRLDTVKVIRCDEVQWRFLGLSLAGYNVLISLLMAAIAVWGIVSAKRSVASLVVGGKRSAPIVHECCDDGHRFALPIRRNPLAMSGHPNRPHPPAAVRTDARCPAS